MNDLTDAVKAAGNNAEYDAAVKETHYLCDIPLEDILKFQATFTLEKK